jgi:hypothetical protein
LTTLTKSSSGAGVAVLADDALGGADAGDLHQDARRAVGGGGLVEGGLHALGAGHVGLNRHATDVGGDLLGVVQVHVEHGDLGAQARQLARRGLAEARNRRR